MKSTPTKPRDSTSVILVRRNGSTHDALLVRRHKDLKFMGGAWVYPGGKVEAADRDDSATGDLFATNEPNAAPLARRDRGHLVALCRETFEEIGVLLARDASGNTCSKSQADTLQTERTRVADEPAHFLEMLRRNELTIDASDFVRWAHWITPSASPMRFDTVFFVALMPTQTVRCDNAEATDLKWLDLESFGQLPDAALIQTPPTRYTLADLAQALIEVGTFRRLTETFAERQMSAIIPKVVKQNGKRFVLLPWHPDYQGAPGDATPTDAVIPEQYLNYPSRVGSPPGMPKFQDRK